MKTTLLIICLSVFIFTSCKKSDTGNTTPSTNAYLNTNAGSTWNYQTVDSSGATPISSDYTVTSGTQDTTINSKKYHIYTISTGGYQYMNLSGNDYYEYDSVPVAGGGKVERLYLQDNLAANETWNQTLSLSIPDSPLPIPLNVTNTVVEKGVSRMVNQVNYTNVIHISTSLSSALIPAASFITSIDSYYAPNYGLIESKTIVHLSFSGINENVNISTQLMSANLK